MKILWLTWKDKAHPLAGGAELITHNLVSRLAQEGHEVTLLTSRPSGMSSEDTSHGYRIIRIGNRYSVYYKAARFYKKNLSDWPDIVIEEVNTIPFFSRFYTKKPSLLFFHQLAREVWFYQMPWPFSWLGYLAEPLYLRLLNKQQVITVSNSTKQDLIRTAGFRRESISVIREGIEITPLPDLQAIKKFSKPTLLSLGSVRPMKRTADIVLAFNHAKKAIPDLKLIIAGNIDGKYGKKVIALVDQSPYKDDISILGPVSLKKKQELMQRSHILAMTSIKEGWGLTVTEANSQGTPVVAYDVDGLRDSVSHNRTGIISMPTPTALGTAIINLIQDQTTYDRIRAAAWEDSKQYTLENSYRDFLRLLMRFSKR